jgi:hypothetical protein
MLKEAGRAATRYNFIFFGLGFRVDLVHIQLGVGWMIGLGLTLVCIWDYVD